MIDIPSCFAADYAQARGKFHDAATARRLTVERFVHPAARGAQGEELSVDVALLGDPSAPSLLVLTSGMHGVEGFCGSGCQVALLRDAAFAAAVERGGVAVLLYHAVNPYGFSHWRRTNEDNIDLNRNFRDFSRPPPDAGYADVHPMIVPDTWPPTAENQAAVAAYIATHGATRLQAVVSGGQSEFADGLFYAGRAPAWSNGVLRDTLARYGAGKLRLGWIDFHTGLGPWGHGEKIYSGPDDAAMIARAKAWYGGDVTTFYDGTSTSAALTGVSFQAALDACPDAEFTGIALEYGTRSFDEVFQALRAEQWLTNHPGVGDPARSAIKRRMRDAFHDDSDAWKAVVYGQARVAVLQALQALGVDATTAPAADRDAPRA
ncbi:MAG TPA: M14 family metallopeptidase [Casimicrobiaceae bacterium]